MYRTIRVRKFRSFLDLEVSGLRRINLLVGKNNTGKTTLLEAIFLLADATNPTRTHTIARLRGQRVSQGSIDPPFRSLHYRFDPAALIEIEGQWKDEEARRRLTIQAALEFSEFSVGGWESEEIDAGVAQSTEEVAIGGEQLHYTAADGTEYATEIGYEPEGKLTVRPPTAQRRPDFVQSTYISARAYPDLARGAQQFSRLVKAKREQEVVDALKIIEPSLRALEVVSEAGGTTLYADVGLPALAPLAVCGEGLVRLFSIAVDLAASKNGVLLIDEIDNGLHPSVMQPFWQVLGRMSAQHQVQIFATTHNEEIIESAIRVFSDDLSALGLFRIDRRAGKHLISAYNEPALRAVEAEGFEVRG